MWRIDIREPVEKERVEIEDWRLGSGEFGKDTTNGDETSLVQAYRQEESKYVTNVYGWKPELEGDEASRRGNYKHTFSRRQMVGRRKDIE